MATLIVKNFSCIEDAKIDLAPMTVLIGPQASGKSVLSKLIYFFNDLLARQFKAIEDGLEFEEFSDSLCEEFKKWFPPSAWGEGSFEITYRAGVYFAKVTGGTSKKSFKSEIRFDFSKWFAQEYRKNLIPAVMQKEEMEKRSARDPRAHSFEYIWRLRESAEKRMSADLKDEYFEFQVFIPAGRSYFTSLGKALPVFEHSGLLDPITVEFGRFFASISGTRGRFIYRGKQADEIKQRKELTEKLFGGEIRFERDESYVQGSDGRKVPLSFLSSGQQELLPLWMILEYITAASSNVSLFIEEPEAHLFPTAQSQIIELLVRVLHAPQTRRRMIMTTHSPYVLTQLNILLKAGQLGADPAKASQVEKIVARDKWLKPNSVSAYAITGKRVKQIFDENGLVDGLYLDEVSGFLEQDFGKLIAIEFPDED